MPARTTALDHGIVAIDTEYARPQQDASHLIIEQGRAAFVDTGVNSSVPLLLEALADQDVDVDYVEALYTEGHARHHYCLSDPASAGVFTGDSFGVSYRDFDTAAGPFIFPTTTPVHFDPVEAHRSIDRILAFEPEQVYLTHFSRVRNPGRLAVQLRAGIDTYVAMARAAAAHADRSAHLRTAMYDWFVEELSDHGFDAADDTISSLIQLDVELNSQGLEVWLDRQPQE